MTSDGERRRALLGSAGCEAAREVARQAPAPSRSVLDALAVLLRSVHPAAGAPTPPGPQPRRDDAA